MFEFIGGVIGFVSSAAAITIGFTQAKAFTTQRLRFVDGIHRLRAPILAGLAAAVLATPITWLLPFVGGGTALFFGLAVGTGVASGAREVRRRLSAG